MPIGIKKDISSEIDYKDAEILKVINQEENSVTVRSLYNKIFEKEELNISGLSKSALRKRLNRLVDLSILEKKMEYLSTYSLPEEIRDDLVRSIVTDLELNESYYRYMENSES